MLTSSELTRNLFPYKITKTSATGYTVEVALVGFSKSEIEVEVINGILVVKPDQTKLEAELGEYMFQGISGLDFERSWVLQNQMITKSADFYNNLLLSAVKALVPMPTKATTIELTQEQKDAIAETL